MTGEWEDVAAEFGRDALYRADSNLAPHGLGRVWTNGGQCTTAVVMRAAPTPETIAYVLRRAGLDGHDMTRPE
ncbi:hypothetical protein [Rhodococcus sp. SMB37]|uniref:hypothetical protein n=1 Tax=Rhodococcus sp. SMB37 TaxID=2512213 RepID=UPI001052FD60|nr:hypothetical protein [Rhodococcus sp. SMB37]